MTTPKHIISAATIVLNEDNEILLIKGPRRGWEMPGGQVEEGESARAWKLAISLLSKPSIWSPGTHSRKGFSTA